MRTNLLVRTLPYPVFGARMRLAFLAGALAVLAGALLLFTTRAFASPEPKLNLSHIECVGQSVEVHFVVVNLPDDIEPGALTFYGIWPNGGGSATIPAPTKVSDGVYHYSFYGQNGYYEIAGGEVELSDGTSLSLHNPGEYSGDYMCGCAGSASCTGWEFHFMHPLRTSATIIVYARNSAERWERVGSATVAANDNAMTVVSGLWEQPVSSRETLVKFEVSYGGRTFVEKTTKPACNTSAVIRSFGGRLKR